MRRVTWLLTLCAMAVVVVGSGYTQDTKKDDKVVAKGTLPTNWSKIGLSADQKKKITTIRGTYAAKIDDLKKQIDQLKEEDMTECLKVLTDEQKTILKKIVTDKIDKDTSKDKDKKDSKEPSKQDQETAPFDGVSAPVVRRQDD
jgi:hypothetical protein